MASIIWTKVDNKTTLGHDIDIWDWFVTPGDPTILSVFLSNQVIMGTSDSGYVNPEYDSLYQQMLEAKDLDTVKEIAWKMQEMLYRDLPYLPLYQVTAPQAYNKNRITGFDLDWPGGPFGGYDWTVFLKIKIVSPTTSAPAMTTTTTGLTTTTPIISTSATKVATTTTTAAALPGISVETSLIIAIIIVVIIVLGLVIWATTRRGKAS